MNDAEGNHVSDDDVARRIRLFAICQEFDADWKEGRKTPIEEFLRRLPEAEQPLALEKLIELELEHRRVTPNRPDLEEYLRRFPQHSQIVHRAFADVTADRLPSDGEDSGPSDEIELQVGSGVVMQDPPELPVRIGRYEFIRKLGGGTFGLVGHYHDTELHLDVALKIPRRRSGGDLERFFQEARHQAALRSTGIVMIYDVQRDGDPPFIAMEFMAGGELTAMTRDERSPWDRIAQVVAEVAEALEGIHKRGYIHRDLKPANVLLNAEGHPRIADCGLVMHVGIREQIRGEFAGSQAYMSPEQLRCEDIDARSDLWSLGVIFYELLTRKHPFEGLPGSLRQSILTAEPLPPQQRNPLVPAELQRICLRLLQKRPDDRHDSAAQVARDLRSWRDVDDRVAAEQTAWSGVPPTLASFQADQSQLYLQLTPGPRERDGTPTSLQFWKTRIESTDPDLAFRLGALYGKSGSGKSSLLRAGLLPSLGPHVTTRLIEATPDDTEVRLLKSLRQQYPALTEDLDLVQSLALLREELIPTGQKLLLVVDQFEQWLHGWNGRPDDQLPAALRQCDGVRLQCLLTIRDDFFLSLTRLMREVGVKPQEHVNTMVVDLFDRGHARKVLASYGQALGEIGREATAEQNEFLEQAVEQLSEEQGRIVCVRLVMLAQMMAGQPWTLKTLNDLGGLDELGIKFLDELIHGDSAPPQRRAHAKAIDCVLAELVPPRGTDIKQRMRPWEDLLAACPTEYQRDTNLFDEVLEILRTEIRLITPTEPDVSEAGHLEHSAPSVAASEDAATPKRFYQLTHDYLVFPLRERRARRERKTLRGRARLRLRELADLDSGRPSDQFLPRWWEDLFLRAFTSARQWNDAERRMMGRSGWKHGRNAVGILLVMILLGLSGTWTYRRSVHKLQQQQTLELADGQLDRVLHSELSALEDSLGALEPRVQLVEARLREAVREPNPKTYRNSLLANVLLLRDNDPWSDGRMLGLLLASPLDELELILDLLSRRAATGLNRLAPSLWQELAPENNQPSRRIRAAATLAAISLQDTAGWTKDGKRVATAAVVALQQNPADYDSLTRMLAPVASHLREPLAELAKTDEGRSPDASKSLDLLRVLGRDDPLLLVKTALELDADRLASTLALNFDAQPDLFIPLLEQQLPLLKQQGPRLEQQLAEPLGSSATSDNSLESFSRQAIAAALLVRLGQAERVWPLLEIGSSPFDPTLRSLIIHRLAPLVTDPLVLATHFAKERDDGQRQAILLALGEFPAPTDETTQQIREPWEDFLADVHRVRDDAEAGAMIRGAAEWLLRTWKVKRPPVALRDPKLSVQDVPTGSLRRFVGPERHEFVVLNGGSFRMGSPGGSEIGRDSDETAHDRRINGWLAIATKEVTIEQFRQFLEKTFDKRRAASIWMPFADLSTNPTRPAAGMSWYLAARYCNWLSREAGLEPFYVPDPPDADAPVMQPNPDAAGLMTFRLPTEAEWEYAARAGTSTSYHFGDAPQLLEHYGWYLINSNERTWPVGAKKPNDFGLFDMHGNVLEWCHDRYSARYPTQTVAEPVTDQTVAEPVTDALDTGPVQDSSSLVRRGGAFSLYARHARSANRDQGKPNDAIEPVGFRVILVIPRGG